MNAETEWTPRDPQQVTFLNALTPLKAAYQAATVGFFAGDEYGTWMESLRKDVARAAEALGFVVIDPKAAPDRVLVFSIMGNWFRYRNIDDAASDFLAEDTPPAEAWAITGNTARRCDNEIEDAIARLRADAALTLADRRAEVAAWESQR